MGIPALGAKAWTTDAFYRETRGDILARRADGCVAVDMEASALMQAARARGWGLCCFLYVADLLDAGGGYDSRGLAGHGMAGWRGLALLAEAVVDDLAARDDGEVMLIDGLRAPSRGR